MREAVILSTARTGMPKEVRGSFNNTHPITYTALFNVSAFGTDLTI